MIGVLGISYKTAPLETREKFSFSNDEIIPFAEFLQQETEISDLVLLSTCNRTEIYFSQDKYDSQAAFELVFGALKKFKQVEDHCWHLFYHRSNTNAVKHLFEVASGIDSMIIGEDQIIGQVKEAYLRCTEAALTDAVLMRLFQKSFEAGKRVRTETGIKLGTTSVSSAAIELCSNLLGNLNRHSVLLIGAGETGSLALQTIAKKGIGRINVTNRTQERAEKLASIYNGVTIPYDQFHKHLHENDIIIVSTGAPEHVITHKMVKESQDIGKNKMQIYIDLSVPRNIEESVKELDQLQLFAVDDLQDVVRLNTEKRKECAEIAHSIIDEVVHDYNEWLASRSLRPAIKAILSNLKIINNEELSILKKYSSDETQKAMNEYSQRLAQRYSRILIKNLKDLTDNGKNIDSLKFINELFKLD